jgi:galactonate dehydratase
LAVYESGFPFKTPLFEIPTAPGLGVDVNESKLAAYPFKDWLTPRFQRPDGSFTNW